jgi:hypothetical protein
VTCENCHSDVLKGEGNVLKQTCWNCHNQPAQVARFSDTRFLHEAHINQHKVECSSCHIQIEHNLTANAITGTHGAIEGASCKSCHEQMHGGPAELYRGVGGRGVPDMPSPMSRAQVDCIACHKAKKLSSEAAEVQGQTFVAVQDSCNYCHGTKYDAVLDVWKQAVKDQTQKAETAYGAAKQALAASQLSSVDKLEVDRLLDDADHNNRLVKLGHGVHNVNYSSAVLNVAIERSNAAKKIVDLRAPTAEKTP